MSDGTDLDLVVTKAAPEAGGSVKSATRVLDLFEFLARWDSAKTHTEIAEELRIPKSSLTQLLKTLVSRNYLTYSPHTKKYALGSAISDLARKSVVSHDIVQITEPVLRDLMRRTGETSALNVLKGDYSEVVAAAISQHRLVYTMRAGDTAPLHATSGGKALLAHLPEAMQEDYLARVKLDPITRNTIVSREILREQLARIRQEGVAYVLEEFTPGIAGMARPILSPSGYPLGAINIAMPVARYTDDIRTACIAEIGQAVTLVQAQLRGSSD